MDQYKSLIEKIKEYQKTEFWEIIGGDDFFKVDDERKDVFVSVMGQEHIENSIAIYDGKDDLASQIDIAFLDYQHFPDVYNRLSCYKICLKGAGNLLMEEDKKVLKKNHLKTDIVVLRLEEAKLPRLITEEEAVFLNRIVDKIILIASYYQEKNLDRPSDKALEKMYKFTVEDGKVSHSKVSFPHLAYKIPKLKPLNEEYLNKILIFGQKGTYELGLFYSPFYIQEEKSYSYLLILRNPEDGKIGGMEMISLKNKTDIQNHVLKMLAEHRIYPANLSFTSTEFLYLCTGLIKELKLNFKVNGDNYPMFEIWQEFYKKINKK